jgi:hypothetical protein
MTRFIAMLALIALLVLNMLGNFWFTYGIWPRSWSAFIFFALCSVTLGAMLTSVTHEAKKQG